MDSRERIFKLARFLNTDIKSIRQHNVYPQFQFVCNGKLYTVLDKTIERRKGVSPVVSFLSYIINNSLSFSASDMNSDMIDKLQISNIKNQTDQQIGKYISKNLYNLERKFLGNKINEGDDNVEIYERK